MLLGNKCDMDDKRVVPKSKGEQVRVSRGGHRAGLPGLTESACWKQLTLSCITNMGAEPHLCLCTEKHVSERFCCSCFNRRS